MTVIRRFPALESLAKKKKSNLSEKEVFERVLAVLVSIKEKKTGTRLLGHIELKLTKENGLDIFSRDEVLTALEQINTLSYVGGFSTAITLSEANYKVRQLKGDITEGADGKLHAQADLVKPGENHPLYFAFNDSFDSWYALYVYKKELTFEKLTQANLEKLYRTTLAIEEQLQMSLSPFLTIYAIHSSATQDYSSRNNALEFLKQKGMVITFKSSVGSGVGWFEISLNVARFLKFKDEIRNFWNQNYNRETSHVRWPDDLKWEEITIRFHNGHEVTIEARETKYKTDFKEMGFKSKRDNLPNQQWDFLKLLSESEGKMTWENPQADSSLKKKKQLLAAGLKAFFNNEEDPFEVYQQTKSYKAKFIVLPE